MPSKYFLPLLLFYLSLAHPSFARKEARQKNKPDFKLLEAYFQRTIPGIPRAPVKTQYHFIIVWEGAKYHENFFWLSDNGWFTCNIVKAHKINDNNSATTSGRDYNTEFVRASAIHKGDTLELSPVAAGKLQIPAEIPSDAKNALFYKTGRSGWLSFPVNNIAKKSDIVMP